MSVVLMYHALYHGDETDRIDAEDLPYAVSTSRFVAQLDALQGKRVGLLNEKTANLPDVVITFDDGHVSNYDIAMPLLAERGLSAYLFVTGDFIDARPHFCTGAQLRKMADAGMEIGSHGMTHRFFDDLDDAEADRELRQSMTELSDKCGADVRSISFPGGRYSQRTLELCRGAGYSSLFGSAIGTVQNKDLVAIPPINRVAIRRNTTIQEFDRIINADSLYYSLQKGKQSAKTLLKRTLGNKIYHGLYKSISAR